MGVKFKFYRILDDVYHGDEYGRVVAVVDDKPVGVYHWTSNTADYCCKCGVFGHSLCDSYAPVRDLRLRGRVVERLSPVQSPFWYYHYKWIKGLFAKPVEVE